MAKPKTFKQIWKRLKIYIILAIAVFAFAILGMFQKSGVHSGAGIVAMVNQEVLPLNLFSNKVRQIELRMAQYMNNMPAEQRKEMEERIRGQAVDQLIQEELIYQAAIKAGFRIIKPAIRDILVNAQGLQEDGIFSRERYDAYLRSERTNAPDFEEQLGKEMIVDSWRRSFFGAVTLTDAELINDELANETKLNLSFVKYNSKQLGKVQKVTEQERKDFASTNPKDIEDYYKQNLGDYSSPEQVHARHILISNKDGDEKAKLKIDQIAKRLVKEDFATVAKEVSEDPGSKIRGGDLDYFSKGRMVPEFEAAAFSLKTGQVSPPVKTPFGYHIIKLEDKKPASKTPLKEVELDIAKILVGRQKAKEIIKELEALVQAGDIKKLESQFDPLVLKWTETGEFNLGQIEIPKIGDEERIVDAALKAKKGELIQQVFKSRGDQYIVKVVDLKKVDVEAAKQKPVDAFVKRQRGWTIFNEWLKQYQEKAIIHKNPNFSRQG